MNPIFSSPLMFIALSSLPVLTAIYLLRNRFKIQKVSSLMLWGDQRTPTQGGRYISKIQTPLLFILEFLTLLMLILAAAGPLVRSQSDTSRFVIVLDDSFSMTAGQSSPREIAKVKIKKLFSDSAPFQARFILAKSNPQLLDQPIKSVWQLDDLLSNWHCRSQVSRLNRAVSLANQLAGKTSRILVITDHQPISELLSGKIEWWSFGKPLSNLAFVSASRSPFQSADRCLLSIANLSDRPATTKLTVTDTETGKKVLEKPLNLKPRQVYRSFFEVPTTSPPLLAKLEDDNLLADNQTYLVSRPAKPVRIQLEIENTDLSESVEKALQAVKSTRFTSLRPHLLITDKPLSTPNTDRDRWTLNILNEPNSSSYLGPFVIDFSHPLTDGLSLSGVIWAAAKTDKITGSAIVTAGNVPLVTDQETFTGSHDLYLNFNPSKSTLSQSPNWPIMIWNLVQWRKSSLPGLDETNILLSSSATFTKNPLEDQTLQLIDPQNNSRNISTQTDKVIIQPDSPGLYRIKSQSYQHDLAVNVLAKSESDLTAAQPGQWGKWDQANLFWWQYKPLDWILLLIALALLTAHRFITANQQKGRL